MASRQYRDALSQDPNSLSGTNPNVHAVATSWRSIIGWGETYVRLPKNYKMLHAFPIRFEASPLGLGTFSQSG